MCQTWRVSKCTTYDSLVKISERQMPEWTLKKASNEEIIVYMIILFMPLKVESAFHPLIHPTQEDASTVNHPCRGAVFKQDTFCT